MIGLSLRSIAKLGFSAAVVVLFCAAASPNRALAAVFRDRSSFNAASQNLNTIDFESPPIVFETTGLVAFDGVFFQNLSGPARIVPGPQGKLLAAPTVGEITQLIVYLPPGTTAVGCDQFGLPMTVTTSTGESITMNQSDGSTFIGFVSDQPIQKLTISLDFPEPTPDALVDNLSFGQRRVGNEPPVPQLLLTSAGRLAALDSVTLESEAFHVVSARNRAQDGHTRLTLFLVGIALQPEDRQFVTIQIEDAQQHVLNLECEATARVRNLRWLSQVTFRLPDSLAGAGQVNIGVTIRGTVSNRAPTRID